MQFLFSPFLGPLLDTGAPNFGSVMAFIAHALALMGKVRFFEFRVSLLSLVASIRQLNVLLLVVPRALEGFARCARAYLHDFRPACHSQGSCSSLPFARAQARRDEPLMVDWLVVWPWPRHTRDEPACPRVRCQDYRAVSLELRLLDWALLSVHALPPAAHHVYLSTACGPPMCFNHIYRY